MQDHTSTTIIELIKLTKRYGPLTCVDGIDLQIRHGELFALLGPNGAGKTTTIRMLCSLARPDSGQALVKGIDTTTRRQLPFLAVTPQETAVAGRLTVHENLMLAASLYGVDRATARKRAADLIQLIDLETRSRALARTLSGGMQRKLSLAMALMPDPEILFLDEPTLGLDPQSRHDLWQRVAGFKGRKTILLTTHYLEEADRLADRIAIIGHGRIIREGTPAQLKASLDIQKTLVVKLSAIPEPILAGLGEHFGAVRRTQEGLELSGPKAEFAAVAKYLMDQGVKVEGIQAREPDLDEVFLRLTSKEEK
jgi:ABC-2 type transport system ATP-binding protein